MTDVTARRPTERIPAPLAAQIEDALTGAVDDDWAGRIWARDASLWTDDPAVAALIDDRLGWLELPWSFQDRAVALSGFAEGVRADGFAAAIVCGMGGSSLAPDVLARSLGPTATGIPVRVLDSTDPAAVRAATDWSDPGDTLYIISSKSATTTETLAFLAHFWRAEDDVQPDIPRHIAGDHFVAITDPGRSADALRHNDLFRGEFLNPADIGGRYSALSYFGLVPAALLGLDLEALLADAAQVAERCRVSSAHNPGLWLGVALGTLALAGRDKLTLVIEPRYASLGAWIEQLVAESTGKRGAGIVPIDGERLGVPDSYDDDRVFVRIATGDDTDWRAATDPALDALAEAGHPVLDLSMHGGDAALGGEFFRWEFATAVAGAVLDVNPFDEPNVTESKDNTRRVLDVYRETGALPAPDVLAVAGDLALSGDAPVRLTAEASDDLATQLRRHLARSRPGGYVAIQAYLAPTPERDEALRDIASAIRDGTRRAVTVGYGPRYLHSTGQLHKGGPRSGCFIQLTADYRDGNDIDIPGAEESFASLIAAQAAGDFMALEAHDLPVIGVNLSTDPDAGLAALLAALGAALE